MNLSSREKLSIKEFLEIRRWVIPAIVVFIQYSCAHKDTPANLNHFQDAINDLIEEYHNQGLFDGTILVAGSSDIIYKGAFGHADREHKFPLTTYSQFYLASVSKQFTATAVLLLIQEGKITPDEHITKYLPELPGVYKYITFRHLLNHTSGIPDYYDFAPLFDGFTNTDVLKVLIDVDSLEFEPGTQYKYSNSGYVLLSILVDRISEMRFAEFLKNNALDKAGLNQTIVFDEYAPEPADRAIGYGSDSTLTDYRFRTTGGGGIFSNVEDLYRWHLALLSGDFLSDEVLQMAYAPTTLKIDSIVYYGFGWDLDPDDRQHVSHSGDLEGFRTWFDRELDTGNVIILLSNNSSEHLGEIAGKIWDLWPDKNLKGNTY